MVKNLLAIAGDVGSISGSGRSPGGGHGNPLQYSCLENPRDGGTWWAAVSGRTESDTTEVTQQQQQQQKESQKEFDWLQLKWLQYLGKTDCLFMIGCPWVSISSP